jgi:hypothetical protein
MNLQLTTTRKTGRLLQYDTRPALTVFHTLQPPPALPAMGCHGVAGLPRTNHYGTVKVTL